MNLHFKVFFLYILSREPWSCLFSTSGDTLNSQEEESHMDATNEMFRLNNIGIVCPFNSIETATL